MSDWGSLPPLESMSVVHVLSLEAIGPDAQGGGNVVSLMVTGTWPGANRAQFVPFYNLGRRAINANRLWWYNGAAVSGNVDAGIYDSALRRLVSTGSVAQAGVNVLQGVTIALSLPPGGPYYFAFACDNTTAQFFRHAILATDATEIGCATTTPAFPLPATATLAAFVANSYFPHMGLSQVGIP